MHKALKWKWLQDYEKEKEQKKHSVDEDDQVGANACRLHGKAMKMLIKVHATLCAA
jgi:hypothetical protein